MSGRKVDLGVDMEEDEPRAPGAAVDVVDEDAGPPANAIASDVVDEDAEASDKLPSQAKPNADGSVTLPLKYPKDLIIKKGGETRTEKFTQLVFHRLTGADNRAIGAASEETSDIMAFSRSTRMPYVRMEKLYEKMDSFDIRAAAEVIVFFIGSGRKSGRRS